MATLKQDEVNTWVKKLKERWSKSPAQHFINGGFQDSQSKKFFETINPATGETLRQVARGNTEDINAAVQSARKAFENPQWRRMNPNDRAAVLFRLARLIEQNALELAVTESLDNGKTVSEAMRGDLPPAWDIFDYYAGWVTKIHGETIPVSGPYLNYTLREPMGVCGLIIPWNYPLLMAGWKIAPALACGNTVVLKPAEQTPLSATRFAELCQEAGIPDGVVNIVHGFGDEAGQALTYHQDVNKVAFTGSTEIGRKILEASAKSNLKRVSLELGGKSPQIIFADANLKEALRQTFYGIFANKGEVCSAGSRVFVEKPIYAKLVDELVKKARELKLGSPQDVGTTLGALCGPEQLEKVLGYIDEGKKGKAKLVIGGARVQEGALAKGYFVEPTIFSEVPPDAKIAQEEIFGPVLTIMPFENESEVIAKANQSPYGLVAAVWTPDINRAHRVANALQSGTVWINTFNGFDSASPFGGYKLSGFGREMGAHALELYTQIKSVWIHLEG